MTRFRKHHNNEGLRQIQRGKTREDGKRWHIRYAIKEVIDLQELQRIEKKWEYSKGVSDEDIGDLIAMVKEEQRKIERLSRDLDEMRLKAEYFEREVKQYEESLAAAAYNDSH